MKSGFNALISVADKSNLDKIAKYLEKINCNIISTGGTYDYLKDLNITNLKRVSDITNSPEILDGRVKTLHPIIYGGILAKRDNKKHISEIEDMSGILIDIVICNLYPFEKTLKNPDSTHQEIIEMIDIGGPALLRSSAKNYLSVTAVCDINDYKNFVNEMNSNKGNTSIQFREKMAKKIETEYEIDKLDGIKISIDENTWSLIRKSNTEDIIRISTESNDRQLLEKIQSEMIKKVECCYEEIK